MTAVLDEILSLKTQAKNRRDLRRYDRAVQILARAIKLADANLGDGELMCRMAEELADCYSLLGGVERRWALGAESSEERALHLLESIRAYDRGWAFESDEKCRIVNSYAMVNRLVSRLLLDPDSLTAVGETIFGGGVQPLNIRNSLLDAYQRIVQQMSGLRREDYWAAADLALVNLLLEKEEAPMAYAGFLAKSPPDYAFKSVLEVLGPLAALDWPLSARLMEASAYVKRHSPSSPD